MEVSVMRDSMICKVCDVCGKVEMDEQIREDVVQECILEVCEGTIDNSVNLYDKVMDIIKRVSGDKHEPLANGGIYV